MMSGRFACGSLGGWASGRDTPTRPHSHTFIHASHAETEVLVEEEETTGTGTDRPWRVILYNDEVHTFDEVIRQLIRATGCAPRQAEGWAWEVHTKGKATVCEGEMEECLRVQGVLREIRLVTEIEG